ncbi:MAG: hypothetical protein KGZ63_11500 [Clostridiales bacterium]|jgi:DNA-binding Xre family transcriptional regulator|nr:hypothetical protein [Clostridiales bacterium]
MANLPKWLIELQKEAQQIEKNAPVDIIEDINEMDDLMYEAALESDGRFDEDIFNITFALDLDERVSEATHIAFLYSALRGLEEKKISSVGSIDFFKFIDSHLEDKVIDMNQIIQSINLNPQDVELLKQRRFSPWRLSIERLKELQETLNCSLDDLLSSIMATFPVPSSTGTVLARSDTKFEAREQQKAQEVSADYVSFKRELRKKYNFLEKAKELL